MLRNRMIRRAAGLLVLGLVIVVLTSGCVTLKPFEVGISTDHDPDNGMDMTETTFSVKWRLK